MMKVSSFRLNIDIYIDIHSISSILRVGQGKGPAKTEYAE